MQTRCCFCGVMGLGLVVLAGCGQATSQQPPLPAEPREAWHAIYHKGKWTGYLHQIERYETQGSQPVLVATIDSRTSMKRNGEATEVTMKIESVETTDGRLISFRDETLLGASPTITKGRVEDHTLTLTTEVAGKTSTRTLEWPDDARGFLAVDQSLLHKPMLPGERRKLRYLVPVLNSLCTEELEALDYESTEFLSGMKDLLRIDSTVTLDGGITLNSVRWTDRNGDTMKTEFWAMKQVTYRTSKEDAMGKDRGLAFDIFDESLVPLAHPLENARSLRRVRYKVELDDADPVARFAAGPTQQVESTGPHTAEITVTSIDPQKPSCPGDASQPTDADREPNETIQSDDAGVLRLAREAAAGKEKPAEVALALEKFVYQKMQKKNYKTPLATAADVAQTLEGDCTEHAVLLAALARASGIPARVAMGLVYAPNHQGFAYHMWTEMYLGDCWVPLDATLGEGLVPADHIKLADSNLSTGLASFLALVNVIGQLKIEVVSAE
ncbi:MAG TPA: transglutaminase domain-containing protein [Pirellulales bacterium]|nr:transglutaminase domain-containing protein [Pirellulales bacterium]